jgi:hypothetical protein
MINETVIPISEYERVRKAAPKRPATVTAKAIVEMQFDPIKYVVPGYIAEGCTILAGTPKLGKSWLVLEMALAVAAGGACLGGIQCDPGSVLYLALEDNHRRLQSRINKVWSLGFEQVSPIPAGLHFATEWPRAHVGGVEAVREWIADHADARLVIVDVLAMFKRIGGGKGGQDQTQYEADYLAVKALQQIAGETGVAVIIVHHTRKSVADLDPFDAISGTLGLSGAADTGIVIRRDSTGVTMYGCGRDIEEIETAITFDRTSCRWIALGAAMDVRRTDERKVILDFLADNEFPVTPAGIADALDLPRNNVKQLLFKMSKDGEVHKTGRGCYTHPAAAGN